MRKRIKLLRFSTRAINITLGQGEMRTQVGMPRKSYYAEVGEKRQGVIKKGVKEL